MNDIKRHPRTLIAGLIVWAVLGGTAHSQDLGPSVCGPLENAFGPYDYNVNRDRLSVVERYHFTSDVENLRKGASSTNIGGDLAYTLRAFPNHTRALHAMARLAIRDKTNKPAGSAYIVECWFERALRFRPNDAAARMTYGIYLSQVGKRKQAAEMLESAEKLGQSGGNFHYNMGLIYADLGRYDDALRHAHRAYAMGFNLPGLRNKLQRAGRWSDAPSGSGVVPKAGTQGSEDEAERPTTSD